MSSFVLQGAAAVAGAGVIQTICLPLLSVYEVTSNGASQVRNTFLPLSSRGFASITHTKHRIDVLQSVLVSEQSFSRRSQDSACWPGVYRLCMSLMESLLKTLRYNFINDALDFVGVHQERILQVRSGPTHDHKRPKPFLNCKQKVYHHNGCCSFVYRSAFFLSV